MREWNGNGRRKAAWVDRVIFPRAFRGSGINGNTPQAVVDVLCPLCVDFREPDGRNPLIHTVGAAGFEPTTTTV
jgi:hypothetical protein